MKNKTAILRAAGCKRPPQAKSEITAQRAADYKLPPQAKDESDSAFRERIAGAIREKGGPDSIIEAHEARTNRLYNEPSDNPMSDPMTGIVGALAQALHGINYHPRNGIDQVGNDTALGTVMRLQEDEMTPETAHMLMALEDAKHHKL
jgi:hypothetical protein